MKDGDDKKETDRATIRGAAAKGNKVAKKMLKGVQKDEKKEQKKK